MKRFPFKFLDAYSKEDTDIFFGRDEEIEILYEMVFQTSILLIYGASGTGKTSLIQCGLACKFQSHDWLALTIRRGNNINAALEKALAEAGGNGASAEEQEDMSWLEEVMDERQNIEDLLIQRERQKKAFMALCALKEEDRELVEKVYGIYTERVNRKEIAKKLGLERNSVDDEGNVSTPLTLILIG